MDSQFADIALSVTETSEWFDWLRENLSLGGISLPEEETAVLFIRNSIQLANRVGRTCKHLRDPLKDRLIAASVVYQCWDAQKIGRQRGELPRPSAILPTVSATDYISVLGKSGRHHLVEANDGFRYVITVRSGLWTETVPATEAIANELARLYGLTVPKAAVVVMPPDILRRADLDRLSWRRRTAGINAELCCGFRFVDVSPGSSGCISTAAPTNAHQRDQLLSCFVFDKWVAKRRPSRCALLPDSATGVSKYIFFDQSHCFVAGDWPKFQDCISINYAQTQEVSQTKRSSVLRSFIRKAVNLNLNPLWDFAFELPLSWSGGSRLAMVHLLRSLELQKLSLFEPSVLRKMRSFGLIPPALAPTPKRVS